MAEEFEEQHRRDQDEENFAGQEGTTAADQDEYRQARAEADTLPEEFFPSGAPLTPFQDPQGRPPQPPAPPQQGQAQPWNDEGFEHLPQQPQTPQPPGQQQRALAQQWNPNLPPEQQAPGVLDASLSLAHAAVARAQLSPGEQLRLQRLHAAQASIQEQVDNGTLTAEQGQQLRSRVGQMSQPLMVRASQMPILLARLHYQQLQHQMAQQESIAQENASFRARTAQQRLSTIQNPVTGEVVHMFEDRPGHHVPVQWPGQAGAQQEHRQAAQQQQQHTRLVQHYTGQVDNEIRRHQEAVQRARQQGATPPPAPEWMRNFAPTNGAPPSADELRRRRIEQLVAEHHSISGTAPPAGAPPGAGPRPGAQPPTGGQPQGGGQVHEGQQPTSQQAIAHLDAIRQHAASVPGIPQAHLQEIRSVAHEMEHLLRAHGSLGSMPASSRERYAELYRQMAQLQNHQFPVSQPSLGQAILNAPINWTNRLMGR